MNQFLNLVLSGLVTGAIYSIMAAGIAFYALLSIFPGFGVGQATGSVSSPRR